MHFGILFCLYLIVQFAILFVLGLNYYRIRDNIKFAPQVITILAPMLINYLLANTIFYQINPLYSTIVPMLIIYLICRRLRNFRLFGLTGGIASGKSTLVRMMSDKLPIQIIDCDLIAQDLRNKGKSGYKVIIKMLGNQYEQYLDPITKQINRDKLSKFVFEHPEFRKKITKAIGKYIMLEIIKHIFYHIWNKNNLVMIDAPILFETGILQYICYPIMVVGCSEEIQIKRLLERNNYTREQALKRINSQMSLKQKRQRAHIYIRNQSTPQYLITDCLTQLNKYLQKKKPNEKRE